MLTSDQPRQTAWGTRDGADDEDAYRMIRVSRKQQEAGASFQPQQPNVLRTQGSCKSSRLGTVPTMSVSACTLGTTAHYNSPHVQL